ncbi:hypothetical protein DL240_13450 [Lujinxingia litoralis]|uniref:Uncharacterized protein n=1 Tax=Lujinxingia litoralis TaxID=2211119 RepID=A0A328C413_9DELT|nr:hypothetical protein [Lujinxingia litoralis]RAL21134.1 hypothetical protein DL240_13450 [Lujinxingia litoralis]
MALKILIPALIVTTLAFILVKTDLGFDELELITGLALPILLMVAAYYDRLDRQRTERAWRACARELDLTLQSSARAKARLRGSYAGYQVVLSSRMEKIRRGRSNDPEYFMAVETRLHDLWRDEGRIQKRDRLQIYEDRPQKPKTRSFAAEVRLSGSRSEPVHALLQRDDVQNALFEMSRSANDLRILAGRLYVERHQTPMHPDELRDFLQEVIQLAKLLDARARALDEQSATTLDDATREATETTETTETTEARPHTDEAPAPGHW